MEGLLRRHKTRELEMDDRMATPFPDYQAEGASKFPKRKCLQVLASDTTGGG